MVWILLIAALLALLIMEVRIWKTVARLVYRTARLPGARAKHKDGQI